MSVTSSAATDQSYCVAAAAAAEVLPPILIRVR